jgi:hypothetical protein
MLITLKLSSPIPARNCIELCLVALSYFLIVVVNSSYTS